MAPIYDKINQQLLRWMEEDAETRRAFAKNHDINEKTVRSIIKGDYQITIMTLERICFSRNIQLSDFFRLIESRK